MADKVKVYKVMQNVGGKPFYLYFTAAALSLVAQKIFSKAGDTQEQIGVSSFDADPSAVDLSAFFAHGGILSGPTEIK